ncbi:hypothetical protein Tco_1575656 [Tanacetum coccineum]
MNRSYHAFVGCQLGKATGPAAKPSLETQRKAILQKDRKTLTDAYPNSNGVPLPPVVFRETDTGKFQPLPEVPGKGKEKVGEEQAAQVLLNLQTPKKKSSAEQYIFQRLVRSGAQDEGQAGSDPGTQDEGQAGSDPGTRDEGQAGSDPGTRDEGQAGPNPDDENLKLTVAEQMIPEEPVSSTGTLSSLQHLAKDFSFGDQFLNDKPSEADNEKSTADT